MNWKNTFKYDNVGMGKSLILGNHEPEFWTVGLEKDCVCLKSDSV